MKDLIASLILIVALTNAAKSQEAKPQLLKEPANWAFERFELPPEFAPDIPYKGVEELRFSPGMFNKDSATYFTYAFVAQLDNVTTVSQSNIRDYLLKYFKGLCNSTAKNRKLVIDTSQIAVSMEKKKGTIAPGYLADLVVLDRDIYAGNPSDVDKAREAGFSDHLTKPINFDRLEEAIRQLLGSTS